MVSTEKYSIEYLCYLVDKKQELNRERRRYLDKIYREFRKMRDSSKTYAGAMHAREDYLNTDEAKSFQTKASIVSAEMKEMSPLIRKVSKQLHVRLEWGPSWNVRAIWHKAPEPQEGRTSLALIIPAVKGNDIHDKAVDYMAECLLLDVDPEKRYEEV